MPRNVTEGLDRGLQDKGLWQWLCRHRTGRVHTRREVLYKGWIHREWSLAHEVGWHSTGEYNGWLILEHWQLVWEVYGHRTRRRSRRKIGWIVTMRTHPFLLMLYNG